jgi:hypothetical protein
LYSGLTDEIRDFIVERQWKRVAIVGFSTHACVLKTSTDLFEHGIAPVVIEDACGSHNETASQPLHNYALEIVRKTCFAGSVRTSADVLGVEHGNGEREDGYGEREDGFGEREGTGVTPWRTYYCVAIAAGALAVLARFKV